MENQAEEQGDETMSKELPEGIPAPKAGWTYVGMGPIAAPATTDIHPEDIAGYSLSCRPAWVYCNLGGQMDDWHYAVRNGTELARKLLGDVWHEVKKEGWPKEEDYPVWVWHPISGTVARAISCGESKYPWTVPCGQIKPYSTMSDQEITHWKRAEPIVAPEPPLIDKVDPELVAVQEEVREAREHLERAEKKLEGLK